MKKLLAVLLLFATPAAAGDGEVTILRGSSAPPQPWYQPPEPPPEPVVIPPVIYPTYFYALPARQHRAHGAAGWPLLRRSLFRLDAEGHDQRHGHGLQVCIIRHHLFVCERLLSRRLAIYFGLYNGAEHRLPVKIM